MATPIKVVLNKKPDDWCLRASIGGDDGIGYYCVYRGHLRKISIMLAIIQERILNRIRQGTEPEMEPEDGKHTSPGSMEKKELREAWDDVLVEEVHEHGGIPHLSAAQMKFREALAKHLLT
jgi:hypothetical protein